MPIKLDEERTVYPANKFNQIGDHITVAVIRTETLPLIPYGSTEPLKGKDGKPRTQNRVTGLVIDSTCTIKGGDSPRPAVPGEIVSLYIKGLSRWVFVEAKKALDGGLQVGDVLRWTYTGDKPGQAAGTIKKVYTIEIKHPSEKNAERTKRCEDLWHEMTAAPPSPYEGDHEACPASGGDEYDPFEDE